MDKEQEKMVSIDANQLAQLCQLLKTQIKLAFMQSDQSVNILGNQFTQLMENLHQMTDSSNVDPDNSQNLKHLLDTSKKSIQDIVIAFQFYDRLTQQVGHVSNAIALFEQQLESKQEITPKQWEELFYQIRSAYTTVEEKEAFDQIFSAKGLAPVENRIDNSEPDDDIELF